MVRQIMNTISEQKKGLNIGQNLTKRIEKEEIMETEMEKIWLM
jgi:hypothetical protein